MSNPSKNIKVEYVKGKLGLPDRLVIEEENGIRITMWPGQQNYEQNIVTEAFRQLLERVGDLASDTTIPYW